MKRLLLLAANIALLTGWSFAPIAVAKAAHHGAAPACCCEKADACGCGCQVDSPENAEAEFATTARRADFESAFVLPVANEIPTELAEALTSLTPDLASEPRAPPWRPSIPRSPPSLL